MLTFDIAGAQIDGARDYQEDAFLITRLSDSSGERQASMVIVADGMGGHAAGNVASNMAVQTFNKHLTSNFPSESLPSVLREATLQANQSITETVRETAALKGMGCTLVCTLIEDRNLRWVSVGDSHLYVIREKELKKANADHSYGGFLAKMAEQGKAIEPEAGFSRNMLMSALTGDEIADIDCPESPFELQAGDRIIIASDGLDTLSHGKLLTYMESTATAKECVDALLKGVQEAKMPRQDNTTVVVILVGEKQNAAPSIAAASESRHDHTGPSRLANVASAPPPSPRRATIPVDTTPEPSSLGKTLAVVGVLVVFALGGGYWFWQQSQPKEVAPLPELALPDPAAAPVEEAATTDTTSDATEEVAAAETPPADEVTTTESEAAPVVTAAPTTGTGKTFQDGPGPLMVQLPAGSFMMGSPDSAADFSERPQHAVKIAAFAISVYEITIAEYLKFVRATGRRPPKTEDLDPAGHPVFFVSWDDALAYTQWLSKQTGHDYRLPSEAQWEYAARGGTSGNYWWGRDLGSNKAHCIACDSGLDPRLPTKVGRFSPNPYGIYDTAGNLQEWVYDCFHENYDGAPSDGSVFEGGDCSHRVIRGGAFSSGPKALRSAARDKLQSTVGNDGVGIRVVRVD
jgi:formylglycine-generating enzyme required for sulfatase activity/serine/threonine protein phosphatase PrpC